MRLYSRKTMIIQPELFVLRTIVVWIKPLAAASGRSTELNAR